MQGVRTCTRMMLCAVKCCSFTNRYTWQMNEEHFDPSGTDGRIATQPGVGTLIFANPIERDEALYQCNATNSVGTAVTVKINLRRACKCTQLLDHWHFSGSNHNVNFYILYCIQYDQGTMSVSVWCCIILKLSCKFGSVSPIHNLKPWSLISFVASDLESFISSTVPTHRPQLGDSLTLPCIPPKSYPKPEIFWATIQPGTGFDPIDLTDRVTIDPEGTYTNSLYRNESVPGTFCKSFSVLFLSNSKSRVRVANFKRLDRHFYIILPVIIEMP